MDQPIGINGATAPLPNQDAGHYEWEDLKGKNHGVWCKKH